MCHDFIIVGGGPTGSMAARILANKGYNVMVLEEHSEVGKPVSCAGLVTERVIKISGVSNDVIMNEIKGAFIYPPNGKEIIIGGEKRQAVVIDRERFDKEMMEMAMAEGAECKYEWKVRNASKDNSIIVNGKEKIKSNYLIGADGARSTVAKIFHFPEVKEYISWRKDCTWLFCMDYTRGRKSTNRIRSKERALPQKTFFKIFENDWSGK
ncbi:hypothetical protein B6U81_07380 [Thermoplasmatales archaeon ex4484_30]|nr:MAG: hypothetical protein B6U81_07380 [Thermoplasmatales archaeon ex4484_30]